MMALVLTGALGALGVAVAAAMWWRRRAVGVQAELQEMRRQQASSIVIPDAGAASALAGQAAPPRGKIQFP